MRAEIEARPPISPISWPDLAWGPQREAILCRAPLVALCCSGRAGKTRGFLLKWLEVAERKPEQISVFVGLTRATAKRTAWAQLKMLDKQYRIGLRFNVGELTVSHPNGATLVVLGANREDLIDVLRGFPIALIGFDEAAFFSEGLLRRAIEDAVLIRLMDVQGELWLMSTPGYVCSGYHYDVTANIVKGYQCFTWNYIDNPHLGPTDLDDEARRAWRIEWSKRERERRGWDESTPSYVREFLGRYVDDLDGRVYKFTRARNTVGQMPPSWHTARHRWTTILGIDYGSVNAFALVLWAFEAEKKDVYCVRAVKRYGMAPSQTADLTKLWLTDRSIGAIDGIVGDSAAKGYIDEAAIRHELEIENADKLHKRAHIEHMNDAFLSGRIKLVEPECGDYISELERLGWDPRYSKGHPKYRQTEDPGKENDACDAGLYGWGKCTAFANEPFPPELPEYPAAGTAFVDMYRRKPEPTHAGLRGAFGVGAIRRH